MPLPKDSRLPTSPWPELQDGYLDEFGFVNPEIYKIAGALWPFLQTKILRAINDVDAGQQLLMRAVAIVSRRYDEQPEQMTNLRGYLSVIFGRLLLEASRKQSGLDQFDIEVASDLHTVVRPNADIDQSILVREILERSDEWTRKVYEHLILGYSFEELAPKFGMRANRLRSKWSKKVNKLRKQIEKETRAARQRNLQGHDI